MEGLLFLRVGFTQILAMGLQNKMTGSSRAVPVHPARRVDALQLRHRSRRRDQAREPASMDEQVEGRDRRAVIKRRRRATRPLRRRFEEVREIFVWNPPIFKEYLRYTANRRCEPIGFNPRFDKADNPFPWMAEMMDLQEGEELLRDAGDRVLSNRWGVVLGFDRASSMAHSSKQSQRSYQRQAVHRAPSHCL